MRGEKTVKIKLLHLYQDIMNLYGEYGNLQILAHHLRDVGMEVVIEKKTLGEEIHFADYDFIYMGCGTEKNQLVILEDMKRYQKDIKQYIESKKYMLLTGNSWELLGKKIGDVEALGILDFEVQPTKDRITSDVIMTSKYLSKPVVGFINKMANVYQNQSPLFQVNFGVGENEKKDNEGIKYKNCYGTYVLGPILVRNPEFLKKIALGICEKKDSKWKGKWKSYPNEEEGYELVLAELQKRK